MTDHSRPFLTAALGALGLFAASAAAAQAPATSDANLELDLVCQGTVWRSQDVSNNSTTGRFGGQATTAQMTFQQLAQMPETMRFTLKDGAGTVTFGRARPQKFTNPRVSQRTVVAEYKAFMGLDSMVVAIDRVDGEARTSASGRPGFEGVCKPAAK